MVEVTQTLKLTPLPPLFQGNFCNVLVHACESQLIVRLWSLSMKWLGTPVDTPVTIVNFQASETFLADYVVPGTILLIQLSLM